MKMKKGVLLLCLCLMWTGLVPGQAWVADESYQSREELPVSVNQALETLFEPGEEMLNAHRQGETVFLLSEDMDEMRRVFIFQGQGEGYQLEMVSQPLGEIGGVRPSIGSSGELYLMYKSNYCIHRVNGRWLLRYVQFVDDYAINPDFLELEMIEGSPYLIEKQKYIGRYTGERDFEKMTTADFPVRFNDALKKLDRTGRAVVCNDNPKDRLHLRAKPSLKADSLGKFYNGTRLQVISKKDDWWQVRIGSLEGWMMAKYLVEGEAMDQVAPASPIVDLKEGMEQAPCYTQPDVKSPVLEGKPFDVDWRYQDILGVLGDEWFILMNREGQLYYQKQAWFWEGNG